MYETAKRIERKVYSAVHRHALVYAPRKFARSSLPVSLLMPLATKDLAHAEQTIACWRQQLLHPIDEVIVPAQPSREIAALCKRVGATYIDESDVLPENVKAFAYVTRGRSRNGWIRQQILKFMADRFTNSPGILVADSDTRPMRPIAFERAGRPILFVADEYNPTYHDCIARLLGPVRRYPRSFVAHCMLFERDTLLSLKAAVETHTGRAWSDAIIASIDTAVEESFSEYETYGTFVLNMQPQRFQTAYWYNAKCKNSDTAKDFQVDPSYRKFNFVSRHVIPPSAKAATG